MAYNTGYAAVKDAVEAAANSGGFGKIAHPIDALGPAIFKEDTSTVIRILSEEVISIGFHNFITCRDGKKRDFACTAELDGELRRPCYICDNLTREITKDGKKEIIPARPTKTVIAVVAIKDFDRATKKNIERTRELEVLKDPNEPEGETVKVECPTFSVMKQGVKGFWATLQGFHMKFESFVDRDYDIQRKGAKLNTTYTIMPDYPDQELKTAQDLWNYYQIPPVAGQEDPVLARLIAWLERRGSVEYFNRHLIGGASNASAADDDGVSDPDEEPTPSAQADKPKTNFADLRSQIAKQYPKS